MGGAEKREDNNEFQLYLDDPYNNPFGILVIKRSKKNTGNEMVGQLRIYFAQFNQEDAHSLDPQLSIDGSMLCVSRTAQPNPLVRDLKKLHYFTAKDQADEEDDVYEGLLSIEQKLVNSAQNKKKFYYKFPPGMTCNSNHFNPNWKDQLDVDATVHMVPFDSKTVDEGTREIVPYVAMMPVVAVELAIDGQSKSMGDSDETVDSVTNAMKKMQTKFTKYKAGKSG